MNTRSMFLFALCGMAMLIGTSSCKKDKKENPGEEMRIEAALENADGNAKTHLEGKKVVWDNGDVFKLFLTDATVGYDFTFQQITGDEGRKAAFTGTNPGDAPYYACYPSNMLNECQNAGVYQFDIPALQTNPELLSEDEDTYAGPMVGCMGESDDLLTFKNAMSWLKVGLKGSNIAIKRVTLTDLVVDGEPANTNHNLNGTLTVTCTGDCCSNFGFTTEMSNGTNQLEINLGTAVQLNETSPTYFWFLVPQGSLKSLKLAAYTSEAESAVDVLNLPPQTVNAGQGMHGNTILTANVNPSISITGADVTTRSGCSSLHGYELGANVTGHDANNKTYTVGMCYSIITTENPNPADPTMEPGHHDGYQEIGTFVVENGAARQITCDIVDFIPGTKYKVRAYASNGIYTYGNSSTIDAGNLPVPVPASWTEDGTTPEGCSPYTFTISADGKKVYFSRGNLQYQASTNTWRFAEHQFDFVGKDNENISSTYDGWIDLLGWGTSGYNHGATCYQPWSRNQSSSDYRPYGGVNNNLYDGEGADKGMADWGYANPISNGGNQAKQWRTLKGGDRNEANEWYYLLEKRSHSHDFRAMAKIGACSTPGIILLPDEWNWNKSTELIALQSKWNTSQDWDGWNSTKYTYSEWAVLEAAGAVFLPVGNWRTWNTVYGDDVKIGYYWTSSKHIKIQDDGCALTFQSGPVYNPCNGLPSSDGLLVRLVRNAN